MNDKHHSSESTLVYGIRAVSEAILAGKEVDRLFFQDGLKGELFSELRHLAKKNNIHFQVVPVQKLERIAPGKNHQGVAAFLSPVVFWKTENLIPQLFESGRTPLIVVLDRVTDVRNFGAIARTAECAGADAIVIPSRGSAQVNADAVKTSAGALHRIPVCREENLKDTLDFLKSSGLKIAACTEKATASIHDADLTGPLALILGSEEDGISGEYLKRADVLVKIPMAGNTASLNVSVAAGIVLFEVLRQRG